MEEEKTIETPKNKWLYVKDGLGNLEKDMVYESKTYQSGIREDEKDSFKIITKKKNKKLNP